MSLYLYKGLTSDEKTGLCKAHTAGLTPPEKRGQPALFHITKEDSEEEKDAKRKRTAKWLADREQEVKVEVDALDASVTYVDESGKKYVFEKGKTVDVPDGSSITKKLDSLCGVGQAKTATRRAWEKAEGKTEKRG